MKKSRGLLAPWIWIIYVILFLLAIPWYWNPENNSVLLGFPTWVVVSIGMSVILSGFTAWVFMNRWPEDDEIES